MTGVELALASSFSSAVLLIQVGHSNFALTFGHEGHRLIEGAVERDFGLRIAIRIMDNAKIRKLTRISLDNRARVDRSSVPGGQSIRGFGVEEYAEVISRMAGKAQGLDLTYTRGRSVAVSVEAADVLKLRVARDGGQLVGDLEVLLAALGMPAQEGLEFIEKLRRLAPKDERVRGLDGHLNELLLGKSSVGALGLALPEEYIDEHDDVQVYKIKLGAEDWVDEEVSLEPILHLLRKSYAADPIGTLRRGRIVGCAEHDGTSPSGSAYSIDKWLAAEVPVGSSRFIYQQGDWFEIADDAYLAFLNERVSEAMSGSPGFVLPPWRPGQHERDYVDTVDRKLGFIPLDRKLIKCTTHPGFEACDFLGPGNELIHVKRAESSAPLSHLFNQGLVSADILVTDPTAMDALRRKVATMDASRAKAIPARPNVVFAIQLTKGVLTPDSLFTFSRISLHRARQHIVNRLGLSAYVVDIPR
jgi:uncharacterized protein (TIGR04141 family)